MSLASHPGATFPVTLPADAEIPEDRRPRFTVRHLSCLEWAEFAAFADDKPALGAMSVKQIVEALMERIGQHLAGWSNVSGPDGRPMLFSVANLVLLQ